MPSDAETLATIKSNLLERIAEVTAEAKPNYNIDGQSVSWQSYLDSLWAKVKEIDQQIALTEPYEEVSQGIT